MPHRSVVDHRCCSCTPPRKHCQIRFAPDAWISRSRQKSRSDRNENLRHWMERERAQRCACRNTVSCILRLLARLPSRRPTRGGGCGCVINFRARFSSQRDGFLRNGKIHRPTTIAYFHDYVTVVTYDRRILINIHQ